MDLYLAGEWERGAAGGERIRRGGGSDVPISWMAPASERAHASDSPEAKSSSRAPTGNGASRSPGDTSAPSFSSPPSRFARCTWPRPILRKPRRSRTRCSADIAGRRWIWAPAFLVELAHALHRLGRSDDFLRATAAAYATPWLESARAISGGDFVRAADVLAEIGSRPDEALRAAPRGGGAAGRGTARRSRRAARAGARVLPVGPRDALPRARGAAACLLGRARPRLPRPRADWRLKPEPRVSRPCGRAPELSAERNGCQPSTSVRQLACQERPLPRPAFRISGWAFHLAGPCGK